MIVVSCLLDREAFPWQAYWYRARVQEHLRATVDDRFRLWFIDNALHGDDDPQEFPDRTVAYLGALETALRQLVAWVERDEDPTPTSVYRVSDGQIVLPASVEARGGVQPVATLTINGRNHAIVRTGESFDIHLDVEAPAGGIVVEVRPDFTGSGRLGDPIALEPAPSLAIDQQLVLDEPGTYLLSARVAAQTEADPISPHARVQNIARARLTVTD
ncbi:hypothetical protein [Microbacterium invictum]|uniref:Uncharacterized protein n=1 Tax=Microbacterium invictum TaxID=515415 RepID=A0AA40SPX7_9MICO|nr:MULTISPECIES: hypothetical protein [Microbacterium]MBB4140248.1 hypothetical protein [Microbacterium invictum]